MKIFCQNCGAELSEESSFCTECGMKQELPAITTESVESSGSRQHPVLSAFFLILCILFLFIGSTSLFIRITLSENNVRKVVEQTDIAELKLGPILYQVFAKTSQKLDDENISGFMKKVNEDTTFSEFISRASYGEIKESTISKALNNKYFKDELADLITSYTNDLLYATGTGTLSAYKVQRLFLTCIDKDAYKEFIREYSDEDDFYDDYGSDENYEEMDDMLKAYSVKSMTKGSPIGLLRLSCSIFFIIIVFLLALVCLVIALSVSGKGPKQIIKYLLIVTAINGLLIFLIIISQSAVSNMILQKTAPSFQSSLYSLLSDL